jgi:hypothetical protein
MESTMRDRDAFAFPPGASVLGGAAAGLSYEGALRDAVAQEDAARRRITGRGRGVPAPQSQAATPPRRGPDRPRAVLEPAR